MYCKMRGSDTPDWRSWQPAARPPASPACRTCPSAIAPGPWHGQPANHADWTRSRTCWLDHGMANLQTMLIGLGRELAAAMERGDVGGIQRRRHFRRVGAACLFDGALQDLARGVAARRFVAGRSIKFRCVSFREVSAAGPVLCLERRLDRKSTRLN